MATVAFDCAVKGNEARSGEYLAGQFLAGYDPVRFTADFTNVQFVPVTGGIAGQAAVAPSLAVTHVVAVTVAGAAVVSAPMGRIVGFDCVVTRQATVTAQADSSKGMAASISRQATVAADIIRVPVTVAFSCAIGLAALGAEERMLAATAPTGGDPAGGPLSLGAKFDCTSNGQISHVRYWAYKAATYTLSVWDSATQVKLGTVSDDAPAAGWREVALPAPVSIVAGKNYSVSAFRNNGFSMTSGQFSPPTFAAHLTNYRSMYTSALQATQQEAFPGGLGNHNYHVDVVYRAGVAGPSNAVVTPVMSVQNASFVRFDADVHGQAAVTAQAGRTVGFGCTVAGAAAVSADVTVVSPNYVTFAAAVQGQADVSADVQIGSTRLLAASVAGQAAVAVPLGRLVLFSSTVAGAGAVSVTATKIIPFEARIQTLVPICGENLCNVLAIGGPFICGGFSGPHAVIDVGGLVGLAIDKVFPVDVVGQAEVGVSLGITRSLTVDVEGVGVVDMPWLALWLSLVVPVGGHANITAKLLLFWTFPTVPVDILLPPTVEVPWILYPTLPETGDLVATVEEDVLLEPTEDEDWVLVPTTERG